MKELYRTYDNDALAMDGKPGEEAAQAQTLTLELAVPVAALPVLHQPVSTATRAMQHSPANSTAPGRLLIQLRTNNTALATAWCTTATLAATGAAQRAQL